MNSSNNNGSPSSAITSNFYTLFTTIASHFSYSLFTTITSTYFSHSSFGTILYHLWFCWYKP